MGEQPLNADILDLATHRACGMVYHYTTRWALTPPFHPYRLVAAVFFCHVAPTVTDSFPLRNMVLYVARTFLKHTRRCISDETPCCFSTAKLRKNCEFYKDMVTILSRVLLITEKFSIFAP